MTTESKEVAKSSLPETIRLTREDLGEMHKNIPIEEVHCFHFKSSSMSRGEMNRAKLITFEDDEGEIKTLENRHLKNKS